MYEQSRSGDPNLRLLSAEQRLDQLARLDERINQCQGQRAILLAVMAELDNPAVSVAGGGIVDVVAEEIACVSHVSAGRAKHDLEAARTLATRLPKVLAIVTSGEVSLYVAEVVAELLPHDVDPECDPTPEIEELILPKLAGRTAAQVRQSMLRIVNRVCPAYAKRRVERARRQRGMRLVPMPDAMMGIFATLPVAQAQFVYASIDRAARRRQGELKLTKADGQDVEVLSLDALRVDILVEVAERLYADHDDALGVTPRFTVAVVMDAATALGLADNPAEVPGYGTVPGALAAELAADADWVKWLRDTDGALINTGTRRYVPSEAVKRLVKARDRYCRFPGCQSLATNPTSEIDHAIEFNHDAPAAGGATEPGNLGALCKKHHQLKTAGAWKIITSLPNGWCTWRSLSGRTYPHIPEDLLEIDHGIDAQPLREPPETPFEPEPEPQFDAVPETRLEQLVARALTAA